jgi:hypothetical protein
MPIAIANNEGRYLYILLPILLYGLIVCAQHADVWRQWITNFLLMTTLAIALAYLPLRWHFYLNESRTMNYALLDAAQWCTKHLPPHATLLIHDAGYIAFATPFHLIDVVGLKTPSSIKFWRQSHVANPYSAAFFLTPVAAIIAYNHPQYLVVLPGWESRLGAPQSLSAYGWRLQLLHVPVEYGYKIYRIFPEENS